MKTVSSLLDDHWYDRYKKISRLNIRSSIYDVTNRCNLRCKGCFFFSSGEHKAAQEEMDLTRWETFIDKEMARGVNLAILIGGVYCGLTLVREMFPETDPTKVMVSAPYPGATPAEEEKTDNGETEESKEA